MGSQKMIFLKWEYKSIVIVSWGWYIFKKRKKNAEEEQTGYWNNDYVGGGRWNLMHK